MKLVLCAYHRVGCEVLRRVLEDPDVSDVAVFTHDAPDRVPDVAAVAAEAGVRVWKEPIRADRLPFRPDIIASLYYRNIIRRDVIDAVDGRIFNLHPSLLPRYRGCSSVPWAMIRGESVTGVTYHYIDEGIDTGNIITQLAFGIAPDDTQATVYERCMQRGIDLWPAALALVRAGYAGQPQEPGGEYFPRGVPHGGEIDPAWDLDVVERFIRAMEYPPLPGATFRGAEVKSVEEFIALRDASSAEP